MELVWFVCGYLAYMIRMKMCKKWRIVWFICVVINILKQLLRLYRIECGVLIMYGKFR
jgi:hypothetical protein